MAVVLEGGCRVSEMREGASLVEGTLRIWNRIGRATADKLTAMGHHISFRPDWTNSSSPVVIQKKGGALNGAADPRRARFVLGR